MRTASALVALVTFLGSVPTAAAYVPARMPGDAQAQSKYEQEAPAVSASSSDDAFLSGVATEGVNRAVFIQAIVDELYPRSAQEHCFQNLVAQQKPEFDLLFTDVTVTHANAKAICVAYLHGMVRGYGDGSFRPDQLVNVAEASKLLAMAFVLYPYPPIYLPGEAWYSPYTWTLEQRGFYPESVKGFEKRITTEQANEIFRRMRRAIAWPPTAQQPLWTGSLPLSMPTTAAAQ